MSRVDEAKDALGELFLIGFEGTELSDDTSAFLSQAGIGGVILFSRNYESPEQLARLTTELHALRSPALLVGVDHEGGRRERVSWSQGLRIVDWRAKYRSADAIVALAAVEIAGGRVTLYGVQLREFARDFTIERECKIAGQPVCLGARTVIRTELVRIVNSSEQ